MKVAFIRDKFPKISETFITNQVTGLIDSGHDVEIYSYFKDDIDVQHSQIDEYNLIERTNYMEPPQTYGSALREILATAPNHTKEVVRSLRRGKQGINRITSLKEIDDEYDVLHAHFGPIANSVDFLSSFDAPFIVSFYGYDAGELLKLNPDVYESLWPCVDAISVLSYDMKEKVMNAGAPENKIYVNPLSINISSFNFTPPSTTFSEPLEIATIARLTEKKGLRYAVEAISQVRQNQDVHYRIAGDGDQREELEQLIQKENLEDAVTLLGWQNQQEISELLQSSDIFLLPSVTTSTGDREGTPTVLLEAQAVGLPIISTYHAGIPEIVEHQRAGLLCPVMNSEALAHAIEESVDRCSEWPSMASYGRKFVEKHHTKEAQTNRLLNIYADVLTDS